MTLAVPYKFLTITMKKMSNFEYQRIYLQILIFYFNLTNLSIIYNFSDINA